MVKDFEGIYLISHKFRNFQIPTITVSSNKVDIVCFGGGGGVLTGYWNQDLAQVSVLPLSYTFTPQHFKKYLPMTQNDVPLCSLFPMLQH